MTGISLLIQVEMPGNILNRASPGSLIKILTKILYLKTPNISNQHRGRPTNHLTKILVPDSVILRRRLKPIFRRFSNYKIWSLSK